MLEATTRADGASVFAENNKWGYFPAVSVAYKAEEDISSDIVDQLKVTPELRGYWKSRYKFSRVFGCCRI